MTYFCAVILEWCFFSGKHHCSVFNALQNVEPAYPYESWITHLCQRFSDSDPNPALTKWRGINRYAVSSYSLRRGEKKRSFFLLSLLLIIWNISLSPHKSHPVLSSMVRNSFHLLPSEDGDWHLCSGAPVSKICSLPCWSFTSEINRVAVNSSKVKSPR